MRFKKASTANGKGVRQNTSKHLKEIYQKLFSSFGPQYWWPARSDFEVTIGAILTQNTSWTNVEKAILNLRKDGALNPSVLRKLSHKKLARLIYSAGYFNIKARRLKNFIYFLFENYGGQVSRMKKRAWPQLLQELLGINGIGPETADSILLYALGKPVFVVDAYTRRIFSRHKFISPEAGYRETQDLFMRHLQPNSKLFNEYHALLVRLAKDFCKTKPLCRDCPLKEFSHDLGE